MVINVFDLFKIGVERIHIARRDRAAAGQVALIVLNRSSEDQEYTMKLANVTLDDKYTLKTGRVFMTGIQALVRLPICSASATSPQD
jgi:hypothetical protein